MDTKLLIILALLSGSGLAGVGQYFGFTAPAQQEEAEIQSAATILSDELKVCYERLNACYETCK